MAQSRRIGLRRSATRAAKTAEDGESSEETNTSRLAPAPPRAWPLVGVAQRGAFFLPLHPPPFRLASNASLAQAQNSFLG